MKVLHTSIALAMLLIACRYEPPLVGRGGPGSGAEYSVGPDPYWASAPSPGTERYTFGDGLGVNCTIDLLSDQTFRFSWVGCLGEYGRNSGTFVREAGHLTLNPREPNPPGFGGTPTEFIVVKWEGRNYLVPEIDMLYFCNNVNAGIEPRNSRLGRHYLRNGDEQRVVRGLPSVPQQWQELLLDHSVSAHVASVDAAKRTCVLDAGESSGLRAGMTLLGPNTREFVMLEIVATRPETSVAKSTERGLPSVGDQFVTRWYPSEQQAQPGPPN